MQVFLPLWSAQSAWDDIPLRSESHHEESNSWFRQASLRMTRKQRMDHLDPFHSLNSILASLPTDNCLQLLFFGRILPIITRHFVHGKVRAFSTGCIPPFYSHPSSSRKVVGKLAALKLSSNVILV